jgi:hypothetical protein
MARDALAKVRRLALVVHNALLNADSRRACSVLHDLQIAASIEGVRGKPRDMHGKLAELARRPRG